MTEASPETQIPARLRAPKMTVAVERVAVIGELGYGVGVTGLG